jgi:hypothetical protein
MKLGGGGRYRCLAAVIAVLTYVSVDSAISTNDDDFWHSSSRRMDFDTCNASQPLPK